MHQLHYDFPSSTQPLPTQPIHLRILHLVVSLNDIRIRRRRTLRLIRTPLAALLRLWPRSRRLGRDLLALLSRRRLASDGAIARLSLARRLLVRDDIVRGAPVAALAAVHLLVLLVRVWVLQDDVPGVQEAGQESETAEGDVYEGVGAADALLDPN